MSDEMDEIWMLYADDGAQAMDAMETALLSLQDCAAENQPPLVAALFRAIHTFKGNSRVLGLETVESRAHLAEDLIGMVRDRGVPLDDEILSLLLETGDRLREMLEETAQTRSDVDPAATEPLVVRLRDKITTCLGQKESETAEGDADADSTVITEAESVSEPRDLHLDTLPEKLADPASHTATTQEDVTLAASDSAAEPPVSQAPNDPDREATTPPGSSLAQDAAYLAIFNDMVKEALEKLKAAESKGDATGTARALSGLSHAAKQLGLVIWQDMLDTLPTEPAPEDLHDIIQSIEALSGFSTDTTPDSQLLSEPTGFFEQIAEPLGTLSRLGLNFSLGDAPDSDVLSAAVTELCQASDAARYIRVTAAARTLPAAEDSSAFRRSELRLYEELARVEDTIQDGTLPDSISPRKLLQNWCADHVFQTLDELDNILEQLRKGNSTTANHRALERLIRLVHHACGYFKLDVASELSMSILDLFSRNHARGAKPDAILLQIARGFIDTLELVFDAMREGEAPDIARLEQLFREASEAGFVGAGVMTAATIERRLGLPERFHKVLSPESTRAAGRALERGWNFFLLRADINDDDALAEALFDLIGTGEVEALTNVTVFEDDKTIFDFLLASAQDAVQMTATLAHLDPSGKRLDLLQPLQPVLQEEAETGTEAFEDTGAGEAVPTAEMSSEMLEQLGEVAAGQAMLQNMLGDLGASDLSEMLDAALKQHGHDMRAARQAMRAIGDQLTDQFREISQLSTQILGHLSELQQLTASLRTRPAETILRPLGAMVSAQSRSKGYEATLSSTGNDEMLDVNMLNILRNALRPFLQTRLSQVLHAPRRLHLAIRKLEDQVSTVLDDDGSIPPTPEQIELMEREIAPHGGKLRLIRRPEGGFRLHVFLPINLVVLEGMVVGAEGTRYVLPVSAIRSILQPDASAIVPVSSPDGQANWLRLNSDELVPIRNISAKPIRPERALPCAHAGKERVHVVLSLPGSCVAVPVDELFGQQLVLSRPLRGVVSGLGSISGFALLSRGDVAMVLSPASLCNESTAQDNIDTLTLH